ncbi:hypothetical protein [Paenarthrobacter ureafaciens]|uniref:hypothetical protein n=1 Tax=Paenarthrobacter ureafaciens TaxID=37931 RepID=UPI0009ABBD4B|nr:hypothetical protein [Paenarthrobacter ureafaciens]GLU58556.1 hypothetical protein Pure01_10690 [Paenarthrobacter ureafaciens]GLU61801.1 hypothetical protein Pure02_00510 [Paenarthrobacter ureafaciens]GLU66075.1 hypothetical protein Pure03_00510 [Paenarthrobacter ureafaciens]GLU71601.1 hypothetical protein Pure04_13160 [Paenarthrobacter ureafaciens]GLU74612.1 hypothetical protein Pure05_00520 [Paenarthrobacter ureafaciens]
MTGYDAEKFEAAAQAGHWRAAIAVLSRASVRPEVLEALMTPDADKEVVLGVLSRPDVTVEHIAWAATFDNAQILGRVVSNPKTPLSLVREIREQIQDRPEDIWVHLAAYCGRVLDRAAQETGLHKGQGVFREFQSEQTRQTGTNFDQVEPSAEA